jgi:hypothetical protein
VSIQKIIIKRPCSKKWAEMAGGQRTRFCSQCSKKVHNLSDMSEREVKKLLEGDNGRICVTVRQNPDGSVATDNCPIPFRPVRNRIRAYAVAALLTLSWSQASIATGQGPVGAPVDPRYGQANNIWQFSDFGYDTARDINWIVTVVAFFIAFIIPFPKRANSKAFEFVCRLGIPLLTYFVGTFVINNFGGLGGTCPVGGIDTGSSRNFDSEDRVA